MTAAAPEPERLSAFLLVVAVLFIVAVATQIVIDDILEPRSVFAYLLLGAVISGVASSVITSRLELDPFKKAAPARA